MPGAHRHVDLVEVRQEHLVARGAGDVAPDLIRVVVNPALVAEEHGVARDLAAPVDDAHLVGVHGRLRAARPGGSSAATPSREGSALFEPQLVARVDPVGVLDLGVIRPEARPEVRVLEVVLADGPERVAPTDDMGRGHFTAHADRADRGARQEDGAVLAAVHRLGPRPAVDVELVLLVSRDGQRARSGRVAPADRPVGRLRVAVDEGRSGVGLGRDLRPRRGSGRRRCGLHRSGLCPRDGRNRRAERESGRECEPGLGHRWSSGDGPDGVTAGAVAGGTWRAAGLCG